MLSGRFAGQRGGVPWARFAGNGSIRSGHDSGVTAGRPAVRVAVSRMTGRRRGGCPTRPSGGVFGISSNTLALSGQSTSGRRRYGPGR